MPCGADRFTGPDDTVQLEPCDAFGADLDHRREVIEGGTDQLSNPCDGLWVGQDERRMRTQMLGLAQRHARHHAKCSCFLRGCDNMLIPEADDDRRPIEVGPSRELQVSGQPTADARGETSSTSLDVSTTSAR